jgi:putative solute:sodium symporter small subunit
MIAAMPPPTDPSSEPSSHAASATVRRRRWRAVVRWTAAVLACWAAVGFGVAWFARDLEGDFFGWPFSFWVAAQGGPVVFVVLIALYARRMSRIEAAWKPPEDAEGGPS